MDESSGNIRFYIKYAHKTFVKVCGVSAVLPCVVVRYGDAGVFSRNCSIEMYCLGRSRSCGSLASIKHSSFGTASTAAHQI